MAMERADEIERKYTVPDRAALPSLDGLPGGSTAVQQAGTPLEAVYFDSPDRVLLAARIALRRRTGGHDAGWHVKLPGAAGRIELRAPVDPDAPEALPAEIERVLRSRLRGGPIEPIALISTVRRAVLVGDAGGDRVEVVDDEVTATDVRAGVVRVWREWEAEQLGDDPAAAAAMLDRVDRVLRKAGAVPSASPAKLAQALGLIGQDRTPAGRTSGAALRRILQPLAEELHAGVTALALDPADEDGEIVHTLRKSIRRLRSLLALDAVAGPAGAELRAGLARLGERLGDARDPLVAADVAAALLARSRPHGAEVAERWAVRRPRRSAADGTRAELAGLGSADALTVFAALDAYVHGTGPDGPRATARPAVLRRLAERTVRRAGRRGRAALHPDASIDDLHAARKAARRARFVVEAVVGTGLAGPGSSLADAGRRATRVQDALGAHRDAVLVAESAPQLAAMAAAAGEDTYALGVLGERAEQEAHRQRAEADRRLRRLIRAARD